MPCVREPLRHKQAQFPVENIEIEYLLECRAGVEFVAVVIRLKRQPIGAKPVIVQLREIVKCTTAVINDQTTLLEQIKLSVVREWGLGEAHGLRHPQKSNPPWCASLRGVGGIVGAHYGDQTGVIKP